MNLMYIGKLAYRNGEKAVDIDNLISKFPVLGNLSKEFIILNRDRVISAISGKAKDELSSIIHIFQQGEIEFNLYQIEMITFGLNLASDLDDSISYVYLIKKKIETYLYMFRYEEAENELREWLEILPEDEELHELYGRMESLKQYKLGVYSTLYRNEDSARKSIESVLSQTFKSFKYYISVSEDTVELVKEYANIDNRVIPLFDKEKKDGFYNVSCEISKYHEYLLSLDADDWLDRECLEKTYNYGRANSLDVVVYGVYFEKGNKVVSERGVNENLILTKKETLSNLKYFYKYFRPMWEKMWRSSLFINETALPYGKYTGGYGGDTLGSLYLLNKTNMIGYLSNHFYHYVISDESASYQFRDGRINSDSILYECAKDILLKNDAFTKENEEMLLLIYKAATFDTVQLISKSKMDMKAKCENYITLIKHPLTQQLLQNKEYSQEIKRTIIPHIFGGSIIEEHYIILELLYPELSKAITLKLFLYMASYNREMLQMLFDSQFEVLEEKLINRYKFIGVELRESVREYIINIDTREYIKTVVSAEEFVNKNIDLVIYLIGNKPQKVLELIKKQSKVIESDELMYKLIEDNI